MKHFFNKTIIALFLLSISLPNTIQAKKGKDEKEGYKFTPVIDIKTTPVKDQASSGTCWSYATTSFIETELIRLGKGEHDLAEMYFVRYAYPQKAIKYIRYQGLANFSQGGQGHDVTNIIGQYGFVPEEAYSGINYGFDHHSHYEMESVLKGILDNSLERKRSFTGKNMEVLEATLDIYLGEVPEMFTYNEKEYTPVEFAEEMGIKKENYIELTSYESYPFYEDVDLELPDNWSHDRYYNLPIDELMQVVNNAFEKGYSVNWDGDVSDKGFSHKNGVAIAPENDPKNMDGNERAKWETLTEKERGEELYSFEKPIKEKVITQDDRQEAFDKFKVTDDHLMHLVGTATDQNGTLYYKTKNSWAADSNKKGGYLYMSEAFLRLHTTAIQVNIDVIPDEIKIKLGL